MKKPNKLAVAPFVVVLCLMLLVGSSPGRSSAEPPAPDWMPDPAPLVMWALPWSDTSIRVPPARQYQAALAPTATFSINYLPAGTVVSGVTCENWNAAAQTAFTFAANLWGGLVTSNVPIRIDACWANLGDPALLGRASTTTTKDFPNAPQSGTWYSFSLADALANTDLSPGNPDSTIIYNSQTLWYFGTDGNPPSNQLDFVSVVMHEMAHSLNFSGGMAYGLERCGGSTYGCWGSGSGYPGIYDRFTENGAGQALLAFPNNSVELGSQLIGGNLYFDGPNANAANGGNRVKIYAPNPWKQGSSYAHLDYDTFRNPPNGLMVWAIPSGASIHDPGPVTMGVLKDIGWNSSTPKPTISSLNPSAAEAGGPAFTLTVNGTNFVNGAVVQWNGSNRTTTYVNATQLTAAITAPDIASPATVSVTVRNPDGKTSDAASFVVSSAVPSITSLNPSTAEAGGSAFTLTVNGTKFVNGAVVRWNGSNRTTTYVNPTQLTAAITAADIASPATVSVTVRNPDAATSNAASFVVSSSGPTISSLNPSTAAPGGSAFTLTVNGTNFVNGAVVQWNGSNRTTTYVNPTQLTAAITTADIASPATVSVTVRNPDGKTSDAVPFTIAAGRKVYLPLAQKPSLPRAGFWQEYNGAMEFFVTADQRYVDDFAVYVVVDGCEGEYKITKLVPVSISGNSFSFSGAFYASGTFNSTTTASGMAGLSYLDIPGCGTVIGGPWSWQARWVSSAQPAQAEAAVPDGVEPASSQGAFEATRIP